MTKRVGKWQFYIKAYLLDVSSVLLMWQYELSQFFGSFHERITVKETENYINCLLVIFFSKSGSNSLRERGILFVEFSYTQKL